MARVRRYFVPKIFINIITMHTHHLHVIFLLPLPLLPRSVMDHQVITEVLDQCKSLLEKGGAHDKYVESLTHLGGVLRATGVDEEFRNELAQDFGLLDSCVDVISNSLLIDFKTLEEEELYVRLLRGVNLFTRNLVASASTTIDLPLLLLNIQHFMSKITRTNKFFIPCLASYLEILANMATKYDSAFQCNLNLVSDTFKSEVLDVITVNEVLVAPFVNFCRGCLGKSENVSVLLNEEFHAPLRSFLLEQSFVLLEDGDMGHTEEALILIVENIISNETFESWITSEQGSDRFDDILHLTQVVATQKDDWDNYQCLAIMGWVFKFLRVWSAPIISILSASEYDKDRLNTLHKRAIIMLDIISDLSKFHSAKQFLEHYNALDSMIPLLRAIHENTEVKTLKGRIKPDTLNEGKKTFPMAKSLIIEIMAFLCHQSFKSQERVRELHGLEVVLSCCNIDEDNPYIKERSILCLRFLLENNKQNQEFVALLEAQEVVDDTALQQAGYEVEMSDGKVKLRKADS